jgi:hypothetical protein
VNKIKINQLQTLNLVFQLKKKLNPGYSLSSFSKELDVSESVLQSAIWGNSKLSTFDACKIAVRLNFRGEKFFDFVAGAI